MQGVNLILMNQATLMQAIQYYLNSVVVRDDQLVCVTAVALILLGSNQGLYEVQIEQQTKVGKDGKTE